MENKLDKQLKEAICMSSRKKITVDDINDDSYIIRDFGYNSISVLQLVLDIEKEFRIEFDDEFASLDTLERYCDLKDYVCRKISLHDK